MRILIVGGGISGLSAAWEASAHGMDVVLCESDESWGGKCRTAVINDCLVDLGPDSIVAYRPAAMQMARELGLADELIAASPGRRVSLHARGKMCPMPEGMGMVLPTKIWPFVTTGILSWPDKFRAAMDLLLPRQLRNGDDVAIGTLLRRRLGGGIVERFADPMVGGIYGSSVDELSIDAVLPSLREQEKKHRSLMLASIESGRLARKRQKSTAGPSSPFRTPRAGMGAFPDALVAQLPERGVVLLSSTTVDELRWNDGKTAAVLRGPEDVREETFDAVILAGGAISSANLLREHAPKAAEALTAIPQASSTVVTLCFEAEAFPQGLDTQGWLEAQEAPVSGVTVSSAKYAGRAPQDRVLVRAFVPSRLGPLCEADDDTILTAVQPWVTEHLGAAQQPRWHHIQRWSKMRPKYVVGHLDKVATVESELAALRPTWRVAGSALHGVGVPDCIGDGRTQVKALVRAEAL